MSARSLSVRGVWVAGAVLAVAAGGVARAQTAEIQVSTSESAYVIGEPVTVLCEVRWSVGVSLASVRGSVVVTPAEGSATNFSSDLLSGGLVHLGSFSGLSRVGIDAASAPPFFTGGTVVPPWGNSAGVTIAQYDLVGLEPGLYYARWVPNGPYEGVRIYAGLAGPLLVDGPVANLSTRFFVGCCPGPGCEADLTTTANPADPRYGVPGGGLNNEDFFFFLARFAVGDRAMCDLTAGATPGTPGYGFPNGVLNNDDFFYYLSAFSQGC